MQYPEIYRKRVIEYRQAETGEIKNKPAKHPFKKLDPEKLKVYIERHPDAYLKEIAEEFRCSAPAVLKALKRLVLTRKKDKAFRICG